MAPPVPAALPVLMSIPRSPRLDIPNPVAPRQISENLIDSFVKSTRQDAEQQLNQDLRYGGGLSFHIKYR